MARALGVYNIEDLSKSPGQTSVVVSWKRSEIRFAKSLEALEPPNMIVSLPYRLVAQATGATSRHIAENNLHGCIFFTVVKGKGTGEGTRERRLICTRLFSFGHIFLLFLCSWERT